MVVVCTGLCAGISAAQVLTEVVVEVMVVLLTEVVAEVMVVLLTDAVVEVMLVGHFDCNTSSASLNRLLTALPPSRSSRNHHLVTIAHHHCRC